MRSYKVYIVSSNPPPDLVRSLWNQLDSLPAVSVSNLTNALPLLSRWGKSYLSRQVSGNSSPSKGARESKGSRQTDLDSHYPNDLEGFRDDADFEDNLSDDELDMSLIPKPISSATNGSPIVMSPVPAAQWTFYQRSRLDTLKSHSGGTRYPRLIQLHPDRQTCLRVWDSTLAIDSQVESGGWSEQDLDRSSVWENGPKEILSLPCDEKEKLWYLDAAYVEMAEEVRLLVL